MQIIDQIAQSGRDCLVFSLEMARAELMSKSLSRLTLIGVTQSGGDTRNAKTARGITAGERYPHYNAEDFDVDAAKAATPRRIELKILKNRNGATGGAVLYNYYPQFNYFQEQGIIQRDAATPPAQSDDSKPVKVKTAAAAERRKRTKKDLKKADTPLNWDGTPETVENVELVKVGGTDD